MLKLDPNKRISIGEAIKHPWFQSKLIRHRLPTEKVKEFYNNITSFKIDSKFFFQQATLAYMIHHITRKEDTDEIRKFFSYIDKNGDGKMSYAEVIEGFKKFIPVQEKDLLKVFKYIDQGKTGCIEYEGKIINFIYLIKEFVRACINKYSLLIEEHLKTTFRLFTKDENRNISPQEFKSLLGLQTKFSDKTWEQIIKTIDKNGDNQVILN